MKAHALGLSACWTVAVAIWRCSEMSKEKFPLPKGFNNKSYFEWPPANEREVHEVKKALGARLPDDYREFLKMRNGFNANAEPLAIPTYNPYVEAEEPFLFNTLFTISRENSHNSELLADQDAYH